MSIIHAISYYIKTNVIFTSLDTKLVCGRKSRVIIFFSILAGYMETEERPRKNELPIIIQHITRLNAIFF